MSASGCRLNRKCLRRRGMSALHPTANIGTLTAQVRFVPGADPNNEQRPCSMRYPSPLPLHPAHDVCWCCRIVEFEQLQGERHLAQKPSAAA